MKPLPIVGQSYNLSVRKADVQRTINMYPVSMESGSAKSPAILKSVPGMTVVAAPGGAVVRGMFSLNGRTFVVYGAQFYEMSVLGSLTLRGTLATSTGPVDIAYGVTQACIVDGTNGYVFTFATNTFAQITDPDFYGSARVGFLDGYYVFIRPNSQQFYISAIEDASNLDALDFASAEGAPDNLVSLVVDHRELWLFGNSTTEVWINTGNADFPFERNGGAFIEHGCAAAFSAQKLDNSVFWVGQDERGAGVVWRAQGYSPVRVSTHAIEEMLQTPGADISSATAFTYQQDGHAFYVLQVPGLSTTLVYDVAENAWHERAELVGGEWAPSSVSVHCYAFNRHLVAGSTGIYYLDPSSNLNGSPLLPLVRGRVSPHTATPLYDKITFPKLEVDCTVGYGKDSIGGGPSGLAPLLMMRYSNDGGLTYTGWRTVSLGAIGKTQTRARFLRCGSARDRVWELRMSDPAPFAIVGATA